MKKITLKEREVELIDSISEMTIERFEKVILIQESELSQLDKYIHTIANLSNLSVDEIEEFELDELNLLILNLNDEIKIDKDNFVDEFIIDDVKYKARQIGTNYQFNVKEMKTIGRRLKDKKSDLILEIAAIIFKEENGSLDDLAIENRKELFKSINLEIIFPYILSLTKLNDILS